MICFVAIYDWNHIDVGEVQFLPLLPRGTWSKSLDLFKSQFCICKTDIPIAPTLKDGCEDNVIICLAHSKHPVLLVEVGRRGFPDGSVVKNLPANGGDSGSIPGLGSSPGGGNGNPLQYSCLENSTDRGAWSATVHGVTKNRTRLSG